MMTFFTTPDRIGGGRAELVGETAAHLALSLRLRPGEELGVADGAGRLFVCEATAVARERVEARILREAPPTEPPARIVLCQALPKGDKMDQIVQKAVELGAAAVRPFVSARCISRPDAAALEKKRARWQRIALEAAQQSGRAVVPEILPTATLPEAAAAAAGACAVCLWEEAAEPSLHTVLRALRERLDAGCAAELHLFVGPEGGLDRAEAELLAGAGAFVATLGPRILRTETAGAAALAMAVCELEL